MRRDEVIAVLRRHADAIRARGVTALYLYGSTARDDAGAESDVDIFADVDYGRFDFVALMDLRDLFADMLGRPVDFTSRNGLHPDLRDRIVRSAVTVFDDAKVAPLPAE